MLVISEEILYCNKILLHLPSYLSGHEDIATSTTTVLEWSGGILNGHCHATPTGLTEMAIYVPSHE